MKKNRINDTMNQLFKSKNIDGLKKIRDDYPIYSLKCDCYIARIQRKSK